MVALSDVKNLKPGKCKNLLIANGWESINRKGSHETFKKGSGSETKIIQLIWNNKTCYPKNAKRMIEGTDIPLEDWLNNCK